MPLLVALLVAIVVSCFTASEVDVPDISGDKNICEREAEKRGAECAKVYAFAQPADNPLGHVELCVPERYLEDAQRRHGIAWPSDDERFAPYAMLHIDPPCFWSCPVVTVGCNAFSGCWCPPELQL